MQLTKGGPLPVYNSGLLKVAVRHFDAEAKRPGLPPDLAALVGRMNEDGIDLTLANTNPMESRRLIVQAGGFAEHIFTTATYVDDKGEASTLPAGCEYVEFELGPGTVLNVHLGMKRFCRQPSYQLPWDRSASAGQLVKVLEFDVRPIPRYPFWRPSTPPHSPPLFYGAALGPIL